MAASPLKIVTVAGTDLTSVHGHHPINRHYNLNHLHQLHHHVTFNLTPRAASPTPPSGLSDITDSSSQSVSSAAAAVGGSLPAPAIPAARRKMSVMHTEPLMVVQETTQSDLCLTPGSAQDSQGAETTVTTFSVTTPTFSFDLSKYSKVISNDGSVVCSVVSSSSTPYDAGDIRSSVREKAEEIDVAKPSTIYGTIASEIGGLIEKQKLTESPRKTSPKKSLQLSPKDLEEHISKIISQNAAIVETDPLYRKVSRDSKASTRRFSSFDLGRSKLQTALLAGANPRRVSSVEVPAWSRESNPEGSIIKDLLLKSRAPFPPPPAAVDAKEVFTCHACNSSFGSVEHLHVHSSHHCPRNAEARKDENHVSVIKRSDATPLKKRKFSEPAYLLSSQSEPRPQGLSLSMSSSQLSLPVIVATPAPPESSCNLNSLDSEAEPIKSAFTSTFTTAGVASTSVVSAASPSRTVAVIKPARPTSLELPAQPSVLIGSNLISPETPRPQKAFRQTYINGHAYTYLGLKVSTRSTYCCIYRPQPMFVLQETDPRLSMYSNWIMFPYRDELQLGVEPIGLLECTDHRQWRHDQLQPLYSVAPLLKGPRSSHSTPLHITHSSYWLAKMSTKKHSITSDYSSIKDDLDSLPPSRKQSTVTEPGSELDSSSIFTDESAVEEISQDEEWRLGSAEKPKRVKICEGGYKSNEDYTYVRGRGRGKYVCEECGIRCKKPSMLKKHIRTHTDLRPYFCKHCEFAFKTKGNLTKHMKSKAHHKKCVELGIVPVPTVIDDSHVDHEQLAKQEQQRREHPSDSEVDDEDEDHETESDSEGEQNTNCSTANHFQQPSQQQQQQQQQCNNIISHNSTIKITNTKPAKAVNGATMLTEKALPALNAGTVALPAAASHHNAPTGMGTVNLAQLGLTPNRLAGSAQKQPQASAVSRVPTAMVNDDSGLPVTESREQEAARSLLDLAKLNCNNKQQQHQQQLSAEIVETIESAVVQVQVNGGDPARETRNSPPMDRAAPMEHQARKRTIEAPGLVLKGTEPHMVEPPRKKSSCVRTPQVDTIEEEIADRTHGAFMALQPPPNAIDHGLPVEDTKQNSANNSAYPVRGPMLVESRPRSMSLEQSPVEGRCDSSQQKFASDSAPNHADRRHERLSLPAGIVRDQPMDLRVGSTRARRLEILPGGIVSQPPRSFARDPHPMQQMSAFGGVGEMAAANQFTVGLENPHESTEPSSCWPFDTTGGKLDESGQGSQNPIGQQSSLLAPQHHHQQQPPSQPTQNQAEQQTQLPTQQLASFSQGATQTSTANSCVGMPPLVVPKQEYIAEERDCSSRDPTQNVPQMHAAQNANLGSWNQGISASAPIGGNSMSVPMSAGATAGVVIGAEEGKCVCNICHKSFPKMSQLRMHVNIHYFERPFRCDACAKSFRTRGHLQKHKRSVSHFNRVNMNLTFGTPTADNPRPFKCDDCKIAFRIHGHLAKHLRSKAHIMKLECLGKLPFGMYAELERSGVNLSDIDTTDCENSLESLQVLAQRLYQQEPCSLRWKEAGGSNDLGSEPEDDGIEAPLPPMQQALGVLAPDMGIVTQPPYMQQQQQQQPQSQQDSMSQALDPQPPLPATSMAQTNQLLMPAMMQLENPEYAQSQPHHLMAPMMSRGMMSHAAPHGPISTQQQQHQQLQPQQQQQQMPPQLMPTQDMPRSSCTCHLCGKVSKSAKSLQVHLHTEHAEALHGAAFNAYCLESDALSLDNNNVS